MSLLLGSHAGLIVVVVVVVVVVVADDETFLQSFEPNNGQTDQKAQRRSPPVALVESVADVFIQRHKVRHLHLVIVDLWRPLKVNQTQVKSLTNMLRQLGAQRQ